MREEIKSILVQRLVRNRDLHSDAYCSPRLRILFLTTAPLRSSNVKLLPLLPTPIVTLKAFWARAKSNYILSIVPPDESEKYKKNIQGLLSPHCRSDLRELSKYPSKKPNDLKKWSPVPFCKYLIIPPSIDFTIDDRHSRVTSRDSLQMESKPDAGPDMRMWSIRNLMVHEVPLREEYAWKR
jgi:hypothetical protein